MAEYSWHLSAGTDSATGHAPDIAHTIRDVQRRLDLLAATSDAHWVEGRIDGPAGAAPFRIGWGPRTSTRAGRPGRDIPETLWRNQEAVESLRDFLHWAADARILTPGR